MIYKPRVIKNVYPKKNSFARLLHTLDALNHFTKTCTVLDVIGSKISSSIILYKQFLF